MVVYFVPTLYSTEVTKRRFHTPDRNFIMIHKFRWVFYLQAQYEGFISIFLATVCKSVRPILSDRRPVLSVLYCLFVTLVYCGQTVGQIKMKIGTRVDLDHGHIATVLDGDPAVPPQSGTAPIFSPYLLSQNGWTDQDATWYGGRPRLSRLRPHCASLGPSSPAQKGGIAPIFRPMSTVTKKGAQPPPIFGPWLSWPNGSMDQDVTWYRGRPRPGHIVLDGDPPPPQKGGHSPRIFGTCLLWPKGWMDQDATWLEGRPRPRPHCVTWGPSSPPKGAQPPIFGRCLLWPNDRPYLVLVKI